MTSGTDGGMNGATMADTTVIAEAKDGGVAALAHRADLDRAEARDVGHRGAGAAREQHRRDDVDLREARAEVADQGVREVEDPLRDPDRVHQVARRG